MSDNRKYIQAQKFKLAGSGISATDTSITLQSFMTPNAETITMTDVGTLGVGTLDPELHVKKLLLLLVLLKMPTVQLYLLVLPVVAILDLLILKILL
jgi:hypothetical protein